MQPFNDFSGGLWLPSDPASGVPEPGFAVPPNALLEADNLEYFPGGVRGRRGRVRLNPAPYAPSPPAKIVGVRRAYGRPATLNTDPRPLGLVEGFGAGEVWTFPSIDAFIAFNTPAPATTSQYLKFSNFGFAIPTGAIITGIQVRLAEFGSVDGLLFDASVRLTQGLTLIGEDRARTDQSWPPTHPLRSYGGAGDLWGVNLTPAQVNDPNFGFAVAVSWTGASSVVARVRSVKPSAPDAETPTMQIFYLAPDGTDQVQTLVAVNMTTELRHVILLPSGAFSGILATVLPSNRVRYVGWPEQNAVYIFDGVNGPRVYTFSPIPGGGGTITELVANRDSGGLAPPLGPYATLWNGRMWATQPGELNFSIYGSEVDDPTTWFGDVHLSANDPEGGVLTGIVGMTGNIAPLVMLKDTSLWYFLGDPLQGGQMTRYSDVGCTAPDTVQLTPWGIVYVGRRGVFLTDGQGGIPVELSTALHPLFRPRTDDVPQYPNAVAVYHQRAQTLHVKLDPAGVEGWVLQFSVDATGALQGWAWSHVPNMPLVTGDSWNGEGDLGQLIYAGMDGFIRSVDVGSTDDDGSPNGQPIPVLFRTVSRLVDDKSPLLREGRACYIKPQFRGTQPLTGTIRYDDDDTRAVDFSVTPPPASLGIVARRATITDMTQFGRVIDLRLMNATDGPQFECYGVTADIQLRTVRQWRTEG